MKSEEALWVVSADMGYGHQRAAWPFRNDARGGIIRAGDTESTSAAERKQWHRYLRLYEAFSRAKSVPLVGKQLFGMLDSLLHIPSLYPMRNLSASTFQLDALYREIHKGLGHGIVEHINQEQLPLLTSFYVPAIASDLAGYQPIYCIICDADLNRVWVAKEPWDSGINYFVPCGKAAMRLKSYGVSEHRIFLTGFPLDESLLGGRDLSVLKNDLAVRLRILDPLNRFHTLHGKSVEHFLGVTPKHAPTGRVLTITFAVGGAGAQTEIGVSIVKAFSQQLKDGTVHINLVAGTRKEVRDLFQTEVHNIIGNSNSVSIVYADDQAEYFSAFNAVIRNTDILWTKPSELSFYAGLGLPIIMTPTIGSQEKFNRKWLLEVGAGMRQEKPAFADQWIKDLLDNGRFADMAWLGFLRARKLGYYHAMDVIKHGSFVRSDNPLLR